MTDRVDGLDHEWVIVVKWEHGTDGTTRLMLQKWTVDGVDFTYADADLGCPDPATMTDTKHKTYMFVPKVFGTNFGIRGFTVDQSNELDEVFPLLGASSCPTCAQGLYSGSDAPVCLTCPRVASSRLRSPTIARPAKLAAIPTRALGRAPFALPESTATPTTSSAFSASPVGTQRTRMRQTRV